MIVFSLFGIPLSFIMTKFVHGVLVCICLTNPRGSRIDVIEGPRSDLVLSGRSFSSVRTYSATLNANQRYVPKRL